MKTRLRGYTLIELILVMGIVLMMTTLALISVTAMLRSTRMSRGLNLLIAAADEARTAAITLRRSTRVDLTRLDTEGGTNRLTMVGPFIDENFDEYVPGTSSDLSAQWLSSAAAPEIVCDGSRCLKMTGGTGGSACYWCSRMSAGLKAEDYELLVQARVKFLTVDKTSATRSVALLGSIDDGGGAGVKSAYRMTLTIMPFNPVENTQSTVVLDKLGGGNWSSGAGAIDLDLQGTPSATTMLVDDVWYRVLLSIKTSTNPSGVSSAVVAAKVWADGQLEPATWTVGPVLDKTPLDNGRAGFGISNCTALADDVLVDVRPIRVLPRGLRIDTMDPSYVPTGSSDPGKVAPPDSGSGFPLLFRPDGTAATTILRFTDVTSADRRYVVFYQNTGRARIANTLTEALKQ
jgi:type II secretory pathway pseudopilin PulG